MIVYLLTLVLTIDPGFYQNYQPDLVVVDSPQHAATVLWKNKQTFKYAHGMLYEVDLSKMTVKEIPIPMIEFK